MENYSNEFVERILQDVLERLNSTPQAELSWKDFVSATNGKPITANVASDSAKLLDKIIVSEFGSVEKYERFLAKQQRDYEAYMKQVDKRQSEYIEPEKPVKPIAPLPTKPTKKAHKTPVTQDVKPSSIADKIGKRRNKTFEELAAEKGMTIEEYLWCYRNER